MNKEQTKQAIAVMRGYLDGKEIEFRTRDSSEEWRMYPPYCPLWEWESVEYRIKPAPIEGWVNVYPGGRVYSIYMSEREAINNAGVDCVKTIKVREMTY